MPRSGNQARWRSGKFIGIIVHTVARSAKIRTVAESNGSQHPISSEKYLAMLAERVRDARARHGMTRRMLARDSGISERYLAQLEGGRGNLSIALLRRWANALDVPRSELVNDGPPSSIEYTLLSERMRRLEPMELAEASAILAERFGDRTGRVDRIALIGLRGAGKSTLGALLARHLGWSFVEMSREIEVESGVRVDEIFDLWGQAAYRRYERRALDRILRTKSKLVLAAGGGLVSEPATFERLLDSFFTVWLRASPQEHWDRVIGQGDHRVEGSGDSEALSDMRRILAQRVALYSKADVSLVTSVKTVRQSLKDLIALVEKQRTAAMQSGAGQI
ncbi:MAG: helix-turn-helix protein [Candidatus Binatus sp.]|nr:helix-turn-helix protein [Candidatus Binatus sp.]